MNRRREKRLVKKYEARMIEFVARLLDRLQSEVKRPDAMLRNGRPSYTLSALKTATINGIDDPVAFASQIPVKRGVAASEDGVRISDFAVVGEKRPVPNQNQSS